MGGFFDYESKPMQILMFLGDLILLNILFLVCCIPLVTIGAAQAGLFTACKVLLDKEDDSSPYAAFWRGMTTGFGTVTLAWGITAVITAAVVWLGVAAIMAGSAVWLACISMGVCAVFTTLVPAFHSRFGCTPWQLIRNAWFLLFAHPLRSIGTTVLLWGPVIAFALMEPYDFMALFPVWGALYYSTMCCFATTFLKKPFKTLTDHYNEQHGIKPEEPKKDRFEEDCEEDYTEEYPELPAESTEAEPETAETEPENAETEPEEAPKI